jgi:ABC-type lipoprotein release transport system permease subunit
LSCFFHYINFIILLDLHYGFTENNNLHIIIVFLRARCMAGKTGCLCGVLCSGYVVLSVSRKQSFSDRLSASTDPFTGTAKSENKGTPYFIILFHMSCLCRYMYIDTFISVRYGRIVKRFSSTPYHNKLYDSTLYILSILHTSESASCIHFVAAKAMSQGSVKPENKLCHC